MQIDGGFIIGIIGSIAALSSAIFVFIKSRSENKIAEKNSNILETNAKTELDARIDARVAEQLTEAWSEIEQLKKDFRLIQTRQVRRDGAITRILRAIAKQWPSAEGPDLDPTDIAEIEETIPVQWIRKPPVNKEKT
jgi:glutamate mutase epsilon subunit